jgi:diguanylate cyclase
VVGLVLVLALFNLALGYMAALALVEPPLWSGWMELWQAMRQSAPEPVAPRRAAVNEVVMPPPAASTPVLVVERVTDIVAAPPLVTGYDELPPDWLTQLALEGIIAQSFVEATAHVLRLEVNRYREQLITVECKARSLAADGGIAELRRLGDDLRYLNQGWLDKQTSAADVLGQRSGRLGEHEQAALALEQVLLDQADQIRTLCEALQPLDNETDAEAVSKLLLEQLVTLLQHAHALRDRIIDMLAVLIRDGRALDTYGASVQRDATTGLPNRIGLENLLAAWWRDDEQRTRPLSAILIDIDRFGRVNQRLSTRSGDRAIVAVVRLIEETLVKAPGFERLVRLGGETFLILQGDIGPHQALTAAERLRQSIEATTFDDEGTEFDLTVSCGVIEVGHSESSLELVRRAHETMLFAKRAGRNRCALDKGEGAAMLDPPQFPVKGRVISLRAAALSLGSRASPPLTDDALSAVGSGAISG